MNSEVQEVIYAGFEGRLRDIRYAFSSAEENHVLTLESKGGPYSVEASKEFREAKQLFNFLFERYKASIEEGASGRASEILSAMEKLSSVVRFDSDVVDYKNVFVDSNAANKYIEYAACTREHLAAKMSSLSEGEKADYLRLKIDRLNGACDQIEIDLANKSGVYWDYLEGSEEELTEGRETALRKMRVDLMAYASDLEYEMLYPDSAKTHLAAAMSILTKNEKAKYLQFKVDQLIEARAQIEEDLANKSGDYWKYAQGNAATLRKMLVGVNAYAVDVEEEQRQAMVLESNELAKVLSGEITRILKYYKSLPNPSAEIKNLIATSEAKVADLLQSLNEDISFKRRREIIQDLKAMKASLMNDDIEYSLSVFELQEAMQEFIARSFVNRIKTPEEVKIARKAIQDIEASALSKEEYLKLATGMNLTRHYLQNPNAANLDNLQTYVVGLPEGSKLRQYMIATMVAVASMVVIGALVFLCINYPPATKLVQPIYASVGNFCAGVFAEVPSISALSHGFLSGMSTTGSAISANVVSPVANFGAETAFTIPEIFANTSSMSVPVWSLAAGAVGGVVISGGGTHLYMQVPRLKNKPEDKEADIEKVAAALMDGSVTESELLMSAVEAQSDVGTDFSHDDGDDYFSTSGPVASDLQYSAYDDDDDDDDDDDEYDDDEEQQANEHGEFNSEEEKACFEIYQGLDKDVRLIVDKITKIARHRDNFPDHEYLLRVSPKDLEKVPERIRMFFGFKDVAAGAKHVHTPPVGNVSVHQELDKETQDLIDRLDAASSPTSELGKVELPNPPTDPTQEESGFMAIIHKGMGLFRSSDESKTKDAPAAEEEQNKSNSSGPNSSHN